MRELVIELAAYGAAIDAALFALVMSEKFPLVSPVPWRAVAGVGAVFVAGGIGLAGI